MADRKRVLIVGGVAGGASCAARLRRMDESADIVMFEKGPHVSFANCGLPYYVGGVIKDESTLLVANPQMFHSLFRVDVRVHHEVLSIDRENRTVTVRNHLSGEEGTEGYDVLVLSPGASPIRPDLPGIDLPGIFAVRTVPDVLRIDEWISSRQAKRAVVVGGGYIGLEMVENLMHRGIECTLIEKLPQIMPLLDREMVQPLQEHLKASGVDLQVGTEVTAIGEGPETPLIVKTNAGGEIPADLVILAIGVRPNTALARGAGLETGASGGLRVDDHMRTSDPAIYAVGDAVEVKDRVTGEWGLIPLAGPANRQGRVAADNIAGHDRTFRGAQGTAVVGCLGMTVAMTGRSEAALARAGVSCEAVHLFPSNHAEYYPGSETIYLKVVFSPGDGRLLGAQALGKAGVEKRIDVIATAIQFGGTVYDLEEAELCYAPQYGSAKDPVNIAGFIASNHLRGDAPVARWKDWFQHCQTGKENSRPVLLDVRPPQDAGNHPSPATIRIPLAQLRDRLDELPHDREIWVHCWVGKSSHIATRILRQNGLAARNLTGGYFEYVREAKGRSS